MCSLCVGLAISIGFFASADALPHNARQSAEGYWVGGTPVEGDISSLADVGVRLIISAVVLDDLTRAACQRYDIDRLNAWWGNNFPDAQELLDGSTDYEPHEIYIHCAHGGDRAGAMLAFFLVAREGWRADRALLAVANPSERDVERLVTLIEEFGARITEQERLDYTGIYSGALNGGTGGLKVRGPDYRNLVITTLEALIALGFEVADPPPVPALPLVGGLDDRLPTETEEPPVSADDVDLNVEEP